MPLLSARSRDIEHFKKKKRPAHALSISESIPGLPTSLLSVCVRCVLHLPTQKPGRHACVHNIFAYIWAHLEMITFLFFPNAGWFAECKWQHPVSHVFSCKHSRQVTECGGLTLARLASWWLQGPYGCYYWLCCKVCTDPSNTNSKSDSVQTAKPVMICLWCDSANGHSITSVRPTLVKTQERQVFLIHLIIMTVHSFRNMQPIISSRSVYIRWFCTSHYTSKETFPLHNLVCRNQSLLPVKDQQSTISC